MLNQKPLKKTLPKGNDPDSILIVIWAPGRGQLYYFASLKSLLYVIFSAISLKTKGTLKLTEKDQVSGNKKIFILIIIWKSARQDFFLIRSQMKESYE